MFANWFVRMRTELTDLPHIPDGHVKHELHMPHKPQRASIAKGYHFHSHVVHSLNWVVQHSRCMRSHIQTSIGWASAATRCYSTVSVYRSGFVSHLYLYVELVHDLNTILSWVPHTHTHAHKKYSICLSGMCWCVCKIARQKKSKKKSWSYRHQRNAID